MANFDTASKKTAEISPKDFVDLCFGFETIDITDIELIQPETILNIISEETMERPSIAEHFAAEALQQGLEQGIEQGIEQGARERALKDILEVLTLRLKPYAATVFKPTLETIEDLDRLAQLHRAAILAETLDDFAQVLTENSN